MSTDWPADINNLRRQYGNFRQQSRYAPSAAAKARARKAARDGNSEQHLALIRKLPCVLCGATGRSDPHHLRYGQASKERGIGQRATDKHTIPACRDCHDSVIHRVGGGKPEYDLFYGRGLDAIGLAAALWANRDDANRQRHVWEAHRAPMLRRETQALAQKLQVTILMRNDLTQAEALEQIEWRP